MLLTNHVMTGALIGLKVQDPILEAPTAFASHIVLDSFPHFGFPERYMAEGFKGRFGFTVAALDVTIASTAYLLLIMTFPDRWLDITVGVFFAALPDLVYIPQHFFNITIGKAFLKFHSVVQWGEFPAGIAVDAAWFGLVLMLILRLPR